MDLDPNQGVMDPDRFCLYLANCRYFKEDCVIILILALKAGQEGVNLNDKSHKVVRRVGLGRFWMQGV